MLEAQWLCEYKLHIMLQGGLRCEGCLGPAPSLQPLLDVIRLTDPNRFYSYSSILLVLLLVSV